MSISFPGESPEYQTARDRLLKQEVELRRATEAVSAARRDLPPGGAPTNVRLSELFVRGLDTLAIYSFMFPRARRRAAVPVVRAHPFSMRSRVPRSTSRSASISRSSRRRSFRASLSMRKSAAGGG